MTRVFMVAPHFQEYSFRFAKALSQFGPVMLALDNDRLDGDFEKRERPDAPSVTLRDMRFKTPADIVRLVVDIIRFRPSVIHLQEASGTRAAMIMAAVVMLTRLFATIALTVHDPEPHQGRDVAIASRFGRYRRYVRRAAKLVFVHGEYCRDRYLACAEVGKATVVMIDHGEILSEGVIATPGDGSFKLLFFGRMEAYKGLDTLYDALLGLAKKGIAPKVRIVGRGPELDQYADALASVPGVEIENGFMPAHELVKELRECDGVLLPYHGATQSGVLAAAFANGRFVIASEVGGIPDLVKNRINGLLVPPSDAAALADAISTAAQSPGMCRALSVAAAETSRTRLSWEKIARDVVRYYPKMANRGGVHAIS